MAFYFYLSTKIIMVFITKSYQDLFGVRSYINAFSKGLCIFATDLRADRHSDWYCIRSVSLVIIRRVQRLLIY